MQRIGIITPALTFFDDDDAIDWQRTEAHVGWLLDADINGPLAGGT